MDNLDASTLAQHACRLGLVTPQQVRDAWEELGQPGGEAQPFLRVMERKGYLTPWQSFKLLKGDTDGYFLGGYRLLYKIASGSFGRVYRADDPQTGTVVAIKVLRRKWSEDPHGIELFEREGKVGMSLRHPNVVQILAVNCDVASQQYYIVMEFVEGGNLRDFLVIRKKLEPAETLRILEDAASGLAYAYSHGITHRDMKLTNILISTQGIAKLVDFGLAGLYQPLQKEESIHVDRTVDYAGLEKATGVPVGDVRSDIFFMGCVLYEMLTGRSPLLRTRNARVRMQKERFSQVLPMTREEVKGLPSLFRLQQVMMSLEPQMRYQTPAQLLEAIREVRREVEGKVSKEQKAGGSSASGGRSLFIVEKDERLQDLLRSKFKEVGYRVFLSADPVRALERFRQQAYDALIVDAGTTGLDGLLVFERVLKDAESQGITCAGILVLSDEQSNWANQIEVPSAAVLMRPVTLKQLQRKLDELLTAQAS